MLDTHAWVWWVHGDACLSDEHRELLDARAVEGIGVSIISCWEVAKLVEYGRLKRPRDVAEWLGVALAYPGVRLLDLTLAIVVEVCSSVSSRWDKACDSPAAAIP